VMLDADLQDPPEVITTMLDHWRAGCDVVYAVREQRDGESRFKLSTARWFYRLFDKLAQVELQQNSGDFRLLDRRPLDALLSMRERNRFLRGMTVWVGYTQAAVPYHRDSRYAGETKYTLPRMLRFSLDAISSFSHRPLQLATLLGFIISTLAFIAIPVVVVLRILGSYLPGFSAVTILILLLGGIELIAIGIIGEYVGRIYDEVKGRPLYLVRARRNISDVGVAADTSGLPPVHAVPPSHGGNETIRPLD
jgi:polyisoprenyl-phosphate glycosyltransferase